MIGPQDVTRLLGVQDSLPADSVTADSVSAIRELGEGVEALGALILRGEWGLAWDQVSRGTVEWAIGIGPRLVSALFVGALFYLLYRLVLRIAMRFLRTGDDRSSSALRDLVLNSIRFLGLALVVLLVLAQLGLDVTAAVAGLGILGLALGFAAKDSLENFLAGVTIIVDRPFDVGDVVEVGGVYGTVTRFTLRSTRIRTLRHRALVMPNVGMINQPLLNHSGFRFVRVDVPFGIAYKEDIEAARQAVLATTEGDERLLDKADPRVVVTELADSSVNMELRLFTAEAANERPLRWEYLEKIRNALRAADIEIPFPHRQLFIDGADAFEGRIFGGSPERGSGG